MLKGGETLRRSVLKSIIIASVIVILATTLILFPKEALDASKNGLNTWWTVVFPSLLPFFIIAELLIGFGVVKFIGVLLEPLMRPLFRVPGIGGFVWAMGMATGNPAGAKFTVRMRQENQLTRTEGERLVAFTSSANPLFIFGAIAVGFFNNPALGIVLAIAHYGGNVFVGLMMRFYGRSEKNITENNRFSIRAALKALHKTRINEKRPIGKILGDAVISSIQTLLMIGGFIILFAVINRLLMILNITDLLAMIVSFLFSFLSLPIDLSIPFISGLFEMTIGSQLVSEELQVDLLKQAMVVSFLLAFSGFSIHAQVASILSQSDIRFLPFFIARILHGIYASLLTLFIWNPIYLNAFQDISLPVFQYVELSEEFILQMSYIGPVITIISLLLYTTIYALRIWKEDRV